jgi:CDP-glucose 4,6-dehydratase
MDWRAKRVFLTGHTGFKGSWLSLWLQYLGATVRGYSLPAPTEPSLFEAGDVANGMESRIGDIRDVVNLKAEMLDFRPEIVMHLAAQPLVRYSYENPLETYSVNVMGTANVLESVRGCESARAVVVVTTDKCYENQEWPWPYRENDRLGGYDPYSSSKACAELVVSSYRDSFFNPGDYSRHGVAVATARAGNVMGGGDWAADRLIPDMIRAFGADTPARIRSPYSVRPWQHVLEPLRGYIMLAELLHDEGPKYGCAWNFGPRQFDAQTVLYIVKRLAHLWGAEAAWQADDDTPRVHEASQLTLDWSKAANELHWQPAMTLDDALAATIDWYKSFKAGGEMKSFSLQQVARYTARVASEEVTVEPRVGRSSASR